MKHFFLAYFFIGVLVVSVAGFRGEKSTQPPLEIFPDMDQQAKIKYQAASGFFADGNGGREPVAHTVPMGFEMATKAAADGAKPPVFGFTNGLDFYNTGKFEGSDYYGDGFPAELEPDAKLMERGQQRYNIYCSVCHGTAGGGQGITSKYGVLTAFKFIQDGNLDPANAAAYRPTGAIFDTITNGKGLMGPYGGAIPVRDRWAIVAYIRTMQLSAKAAGLTK